MSQGLLKMGLQMCLAALLASAMWGCESIPDAGIIASIGEMAEPGEQSAEPAGQGWAVGRIAVVDEKGPEVEFSDSIWSMYHFSVWVLSKQTGAMSKFRVVGDGSFVWQLAPGEYVLAGFYGILDHSGGGLGRIWAAFEVKPAPQASYVGTVTVCLERNYYRVGLRDDYALLPESVRERMQSSGRVAVKALFDFEGRLANYETVSGICATEWGIDCGYNLKGVEPLSPESGSGGSFPEASSVSPVFEWKSAALSGVTYDFALYETVQMPGAGNGGRIRGAPVAYAEGLEQPQFVLATPLAPKRQYEWSVRLRKGSKVSTWSTSGYFVFFVVGFATGYGYWFQFSTP